MTQELLRLQAATLRAVLDDPAVTDVTLRRQVASGQPPSELQTLVQKIRERAYTVTDEDVDALRARYSEAELFEIIVAAALGAADDRFKAALAAVEGL